MMYYVYFLRSKKTGKYYIGQTSKHPLKRLEEHNNGLSRWTNQHKPLRLVYYEKFHCRKDSVEREQFYKSGFGKQIKKLILEYLAESK